jgi:hypothetical protein
MKAKALGVVAALALLVCLVSEGRASTVNLVPTAVGNVVDDAGGVADGTFDRVEATSFPEVDATNNFTYRAVMEFNLASISTAVVNSAQLHWDLGNATDPPVTVQLYGYAGDGVLSVGDAQQNNLIATASIPQYGDGGATTFSIDVTSLLTFLVTANDPFAGLMFRLPVEPPFPNQKMEQFRSPMLSIDFSPTPLPAALPLFATGLGAMGLLGWRRKRKAAAIAA